ncbi:flagellar export chaperone FliS [Vulgatibacter incomptus]|uniref:Flagellar biosynthesis protein FliS n=1 Tax=Vulgatibacter incomptus TaxID=1391653 RepID=A0A0K1PHW1_9BACT|nr:flagellar export chaperone FliS [Vulgatibacter incomptus]AKU92991.1 Flagellar biosynthesis protein FliS [Vulgatibacter incomptus]
MNAAAIYNRTQAQTADPERIMLLLFEGALARIRRGAAELEQGQRGKAADALERASEIVLELRGSLDHDRAPEICEQLSALYVYVATRLTRAISSGDPAYAREAEETLAPIADAFGQAVAQVRAR